MKNKYSFSYKFIVFMLALAFALLPVSTVYCANSNKGSVSVTFAANDGKDPMEGADITIYKVADYDEDETDLEKAYRYTDDFSGCGVALSDAGKSNTAEVIADYVNRHDIAGVTKETGADGRVIFDELELGLYLVMQTGGVDGFATCKPFFAFVPKINGDEKIYDVDATPKVDLETYVDISVEKIWNDDGEHRPKSIQVSLLKSNKKVETVTLSDENDWSYVWYDLEKADDYSVKEDQVPKGYKVTYKQDGYEFIIENTATLIQTGQLKWPIPLLMLGGVLFILIGVNLNRKKNDDLL